MRATPTSALPTLAQLGMQTETNSSSLTNPFTPCNRNTNDPEHDFYQHTRWFKEFALVPLIVILEFAMYTLLLAAFQDTVFSRLLELPYGIWFWAFVYCPTYGISYILLGFLFSGKVRSPPLRPRVALCLRKFPLVCVVIIITIISPLLDLPPLLGYEFILVVCPPGVYLLLSLISIIHSWVLRRSHGS